MRIVCVRFGMVAKAYYRSASEARSGRYLLLLRVLYAGVTDIKLQLFLGRSHFCFYAHLSFTTLRAWRENRCLFI